MPGMDSGAKMLRSYKINRNQVPKRKRLKEIHKTHKEAPGQMLDNGNKLSPEEMATFRLALKKQRRNARRLRIFVYLVVTSAVIRGFIWLSQL